MRSEALQQALEAKGYATTTLDRNTPLRGSDLVIQTGFNRTPPLMDAIERGIPYIIMEEPIFRGFYDSSKASSWGYNGLAGGAWRPTPPWKERPKPNLEPWKTEGGTLIIGQKPNDHSLRGSDHVKWLIDRFCELPEADFRPHPLMVPLGTLQPLQEVLRGYRDVVIYNSTAGVEALISGSKVRADGHGHLLPADQSDRDNWLHQLSYAQGAHCEFGNMLQYILSGYEEARARANSGDIEVPRRKIDGPSVCERYYQTIKRSS